MKADVKAKWIEALRSGKYQQGHKWLRPQPDKFCCLGVLCDVIKPDGWQDGHWLEAEDQEGYTDSADAELPSNTRIDCDITQSEMDYLIEMNDNNEDSFAIIADWIEKYL